MNEPIEPHDVTRVTVSGASGQMPYVIDGVAALVVVTPDPAQPGMCIIHMRSPSAEHAAAMVAMAIAQLRQGFGEHGVQMALSAGVTLKDTGSDLGLPKTPSIQAPAADEPLPPPRRG